MNGLQLGRVFGIPLRVEFTALLVLGLLALQGARDGPAQMIFGLFYAAVIFGSILVHELGHALAARRVGLGVQEIVLHGFGGLTRFARPPGPRHGVGITLAGPGAGLVLGGLGVVVAFGLAFAGAPRAVLGLVSKFVEINLYWSLFNLVPMYPLDGGLVVYHLVARRRGSAAALRTAATLGIVVAGIIVLGAMLSESDYTMLGIVAAFSAFQCFTALRSVR